MSFVFAVYDPNVKKLVLVTATKIGKIAHFTPPNC